MRANECTPGLAPRLCPTVSLLKLCSGRWHPLHWYCLASCLWSLLMVVPCHARVPVVGHCANKETVTLSDVGTGRWTEVNPWHRLPDDHGTGGGPSAASASASGGAAGVHAPSTLSMSVSAPSESSGGDDNGREGHPGCTPQRPLVEQPHTATFDAHGIARFW